MALEILAEDKARAGEEPERTFGVREDSEPDRNAVIGQKISA